MLKTGLNESERIKTWISQEVDRTATTMGSDGKPEVKEITRAEITVSINTVGGSDSKLVKTGSNESTPGAASKVSLQVSISAKRGDFNYQGARNINITITRPDGAKGVASYPAQIEKGNTGSPSILNVTGGRDQYHGQMIPFKD